MKTSSEYAFKNTVYDRSNLKHRYVFGDYSVDDPLNGVFIIENAMKWDDFYV